jgi:acyl-CoA synthetase (AMP-forming)/AMP-acid ligase II
MAIAMTPTWHAEQTPDAPAIVMSSSGETSTFAELEDRSVRLARGLQERGVVAGDHIAILMENNRKYLEVAWAAQRSGLHYTAINRHLRPAEVQYVLDDCGAVALVASEQTTPVVASLDLSRLRVRIAADVDSHDSDFRLSARLSPVRALYPTSPPVESKFAPNRTWRPSGSLILGAKYWSASLSGSTR